MSDQKGRLRARQRLGKYRIKSRLGEGGFAAVYKAYDEVEGVDVALKVPFPTHVTDSMLDSLRHEVRLTARLDHPNVLHLKNADYVDGRFVVVYPLGEETLHERLQRRLSARRALDLLEQLLRAMAHAHERGVLHCDLKPENLILFSERLRVADFGIGRIARRTVVASGSGTVGYMAPEQAMGKVSRRSDVFSIGLLAYRMLAGVLPEWPFDWPLPGHERLRKKVHPDLISWLRRALEVNDRKRFRDGAHLLEAFLRVRPRALRPASGRRKRTATAPDWRAVRRRQFLRKYRRELSLTLSCRSCDGPLGEAMRACPWCGVEGRQKSQEPDFPATCPRCRLGVKLDWRYCAWCYGSAIGPLEDRTYRDRRYSARCHNRRCGRRDLMPFMRYCPWCRVKVQRRWTVAGSKDRCRSCGWGVLADVWSYCPWCARKQ